MPVFITLQLDGSRGLLTLAHYRLCL